MTILHNQYVNQVRQLVRRGPMDEFDDTARQLSRPATQEAGLELRDLDRALGRLPLEQRAVILLIGLEGMSYDEVAATLNVPVGTVRSRLSRGRSALGHLMGIQSRPCSPRQETRPRAFRREKSNLRAEPATTVVIAA